MFSVIAMLCAWGCPWPCFVCAMGLYSLRKIGRIPLPSLACWVMLCLIVVSLFWLFSLICCCLCLSYVLFVLRYLLLYVYVIVCVCVCVCMKVSLTCFDWTIDTNSSLLICPEPSLSHFMKTCLNMSITVIIIVIIVIIIVSSISSISSSSSRTGILLSSLL